MKRDEPGNAERRLALAVDGLGVIRRALLDLGCQKEIRYAEVWAIASKVEALEKMIRPTNR